MDPIARHGAHRRIEFHDNGPDHLGRRHYTLYWMADYHPGHPDGEHRLAERAQGFFAVPPGEPLQ